MTSHRLKTSVVVISAHGDIDASNVGALTEYALGHVTGCRILILDLRGLDFFGAEGFSVLQRLATCCPRAGTAWAVVPGAAGSRMLRIGDPDASLPVADTVDAALATCCEHPGWLAGLIVRCATPRQSWRCGRTVCGVCGGITDSGTKTGGLQTDGCV